MVMRRSDIKRISKDVADTLEDNPKRTKVHAQRKFAQGSGMNSPVMTTPVKDKEKTKVNGTSSSPELLPSKRPRTEDFLTFLCFRGTEALPSRLDFFNLASKSTKQDKDGSTPGSSKQSATISQQENKVKRVKSKLKNTKVVHSLKDKLHEKRLATRSTRLTQKTASLLPKPRPLEDRQKKVGSIISKKQLVVRGRPAHHPSILKRLGATRLRTGLRSGGQLPPGSDVGIKTDRKPRKKLMRSKANKVKKGVVTRAKITRKTEDKESESDDEKEDDDNEEDTENDKNENDSLEERKEEEEDADDSDSKDRGSDEPAPKKSCRMSTRSRASSGSPAHPPNSLSIPTRPSRKTKEAATLYMEMLTKDLRSPEEEEDERFGKGSPENLSSTSKRADESPDSTTPIGMKKSKQNKSSEQLTDKETQIKDVPVLTRASRRGRMKREHENLNKGDFRLTRGQRSGIQQRGRPSLRRGRGRPPLTRAPEVHRVLRNVRKVTNFAEDESETEDEEDEMFVESLLSEEMERLEVGPGRLRPARSSTSLAKSGRTNKTEIDNSQDEQETQENLDEGKAEIRRKTRSHSNITVVKTVYDSSEEDSRRQTRSSKDKEDVKERKRSLPLRRSRLNNSESDTEKNGNSQKEKPPSKKGRKENVNKFKDTKENSDKEKQAYSGSKTESSSVGKKSFLQEKKEMEDSCIKVSRNQSDQSVAYLLLSLSQVKSWPESENDGHTNEDISMRSTRSSLKELPKDETRIRRGRRRNTSIDSGLVSEKTDEEKPATSSKKNKRDAVTLETVPKGKTRSSNKGELEVNTDDDETNTSLSKGNQSEDLISKKVQKKETHLNKGKIHDSKPSSESEEEKTVNRKNVKHNNDVTSAFSPTRTRRPKVCNKENEDSSQSEIDLKSNDSKMKDKVQVKREKRGRKKSCVLKKGESLDFEVGKKDTVSDDSNSAKLKKSGSLQNFAADTMETDVSDLLRESSLDAPSKVMPETNEVEKLNEACATKGETLKEDVHSFKKEKDTMDVLDVNKDAQVLITEESKRSTLRRKCSADSSTSHSSVVDCKVLLESNEVAEPFVKKVSDKNKASEANVEKTKDNTYSGSEEFQDKSYKKKDFYSCGGKQEDILPNVSDELYKKMNLIEVTKSPIIEITSKPQNKCIKDISSSDESDKELSSKEEKELENRNSFGTRKRFPRRSRIEYFSHANSSRDAPKRTFHSRKVKSLSERYIDEDSYSSDISSTSEESRISAIKSHKRIKPKNSTQNDAIESAMREAQNAVLKQEQKEVVSCHIKVDTFMNKNVANISSSIPEINLKKEIVTDIHKTSDIKKCLQVSTSSLGESKLFESLISEKPVDKVLITHQGKVTGKLPDNSTLLTKSHPLNDTKFSKIEQFPQTNISGLKTSILNLSNDSIAKQINMEGENKKQSMSETWRQAFKNAKIPKPGQSSPVSPGVKPFVRKPFGTSSLGGTKQTDVLKGITTNLPKITGAMNQFKSSAFQTIGKYSPNRSFPGEESIKSQSPSRRAIEIRDSPSKSSVSSSDDSRIVSTDVKKSNEPPVKSLTQLQYEKRSSDLISSLKDAPIIIDPSYPVAPFTSKLKEAAIEANPQRASKPVSASPLTKAAEGKHLNLPLPVEHTLRKMSPITVSKKPLIGKNLIQADKKVSPTPFSEKQKVVSDEVKEDSIKSEPQIEETSAPRTSNIEMLGKKKVNMTTEEIKRWLDDSTSSGIEHAKNCGIFEKNECECSYRTSGPSMLVGRGGTVGETTSDNDNRGMITVCQQAISNAGVEMKVDRGFVEPPVQLRELAEIACSSKYGGEIITPCKVEDYRECLLSKNKDILQKQPRRRQSSSFKSDRSMTEEEMCEFDFRFDRSSNSPRESGSEMSSPPPLRDDVSEKSDLQHTSPSERKPIFQQRRSCGIALKRPPQSKSPAAAFSAENESSVYAFEPEEPPVSLLDKPFRRRSSKGTRDDEAPLLSTLQPPSSSIAVQVNLESEAVLETEAVLECCTTQTEHSQDDEENGTGGRSFYIPIEQGSSQLIPQQTIKGVTLKVESEGPNNQRVMLRAKLVTKPPSNFATPSTSHRSLVEGNTESGGSAGGSRRRPEQKVRPLSARAPPLVGTVQPTLREGIDQNVTGISTKIEKPKQASQGTQSSPRPSNSPSNIAESCDTEAILKSKSNLGKAVNNPCPEGGGGNFPQHRVTGTATVIEAPTFYPTEKEFGDPLEYIEKITPLAQHLGICRIVPPSSFKPECKVSDEMRFTAYNQYIHKMLHRWGPNVREMSAIRKYLVTQNIALNQPPLIGGIEVDLPRLYQTVQQCGGLKEVYEKKRWTKVADVMKIPRSSQDRVTKLDDIYCKFLLPYDTLSHSERSKLLEEVEVEWREREKRMLEEDDDVEKEEGSDNESDTDERDECITKGKSMALSGFYRIARNTMSTWFSKDSTPGPLEVENEFWRHVTTGTAHVCVHSGSIDTSTWGCGFPTGKERSTAKHPWNLKILTNNPRSIMRSLGPVLGVTVPTLHVGMLFSACCWYRDPHALPWIEYLHTGASKIWYGVPDSWSEELKIAVKRLMPRYCREKKKIWLASDTVMVPPQLLVAHGVSLCRTVQEPGQFVVVFPRAFTSSLCTGYLVSESVYFAHSSWLDTSRSVFKDIQDSCEPPIFSLEKLLFNIATDIRSSGEVLSQILPMVIELRNEEVSRRKILEGFGLVADEKLPVTKGRRTKSQEEPNEYECELCRGNLFLSLVTNTQDEINYCLVHAIETISKDKDVLKNCKLMYAYDEEEMEELIEKIKNKIETKKNQKKQGKSYNTSSSSKS